MVKVKGKEFAASYTHELEYTKKELKKQTQVNTSEYSSEEQDELKSTRILNLHWCKCKNCVVLPTFHECKCCKEFKKLLGSLLASLECITQHEEFFTL